MHGTGIPQKTESPINMTERLYYVQCVGYPQSRYNKIRIKVELGQENDEPAEMLLSFDEAQRLRDDLANQLLARGIPC
jgi:hypothetical protein